jgi:ABC-type transport system substrate-binding protein
MPYNDSIGLSVEPLGTGPYVLESYENEEQHFVAYSGYWRAQPQIQEMRWIRFADSVALAQGFLGGDVDRPESAHPDFIEQYEAAPSIYVDPPMKGTCINYLGMNMQDINLTFRKAISYGINYDYICTDVMNNQAMRSISPIPDGIMYHDPTATPFPYNVTLGRKVLIDAGLTTLTLASSSTAWSNLVGSAPIATFNYTYNIGNRIRGDIGLLIQTNLAQLGIKVVLEGVSWPQFLDALYVYPDRLQLFQVGWCADYNDPSNYINPLFSNTSYGNSAQVNDPWLQDKMMEALSETNATARKALYYEMQEYLTEDLIPWCYLFVGISKAAWSVHLTEVPRNAMGKLYFYPCHWYEETTTTGGIPGFSFIALLGAAAVTIGVLLYKRRR